MIYRNFDLEAFDHARQGETEDFRVRVLTSPAGEQSLDEASAVTFAPPLRTDLSALDSRPVALDELIRLGTQLGDLLFPPDTAVRQLFLDSLGGLGDDRLRIRLRLDDYALADLPWEFAYVVPPNRPAGSIGPNGFLSLDHRISMVRAEQLSEPHGSLEPVGAKPWPLAALLASPLDGHYEPLSLELEEGAIRDSLDRLADAIRLEFFPGATLESLEKALSGPVHIFHFAGHGDFAQATQSTAGESVGGASQGFIVLQDPSGNSKPLGSDRLAVYLSHTTVRLAVLGACRTGRRNEMNPWTGVASALVGTARIPAVVGMQYKVADQNAINFSKALYQTLAREEPIDAAVSAGRRATFLRDDQQHDWGAPVLYLRTDQAVLFPGLTATGEGRTWDDVVARSKEHTERFLSSLKGTAESPGTYIPETYVERVGTLTTLDAFLRSDHPALILKGESGIGKTTLLCAWAEKLLQDGSAVFLHSGAAAFDADVSKEIARDLALGNPDGLAEAIEQVATGASAAGRSAVLIFDGLNEFRGSDSVGPTEMLKAIDGLVRTLPGQNVRAVVACSSATWRQLERDGRLEFTRSLYFHPTPQQNGLELGPFSDQEVALAFDRYADRFELKTRFQSLPPIMRENLRVPLQLRLVAETYRAQEVPRSRDGWGIGLLRGFYLRQSTESRRFLDALGNRMLALRRSSLSVSEMTQEPTLRDEIQKRTQESAYRSLIDAGILTETQDAALLEDVASFTQSTFGAFVLAAQLARELKGENVGLRARTLAAQSDTFPMAWDVARLLLVLRATREDFLELAGDVDAQTRQLAVEALVDLASNDPVRAVDEILALLQSAELPGSRRAEAWRTGLKAAYFVGPPAERALLWAALRGSDPLRTAVTYVLYLLWRTDPDFIWELLNGVASDISLRNLPTVKRRLEFLGRMTVTIYINNCERREVAQRTSDLWEGVFKDRLKLHVTAPPFLDPLIFRAVARFFSQPILDAVMFGQVQPPDRFFRMSEEERARFSRAVPLVEPDSVLESSREDLKGLLSSGILQCNILGALAVAVHANRDFASIEPFLRQVFEELNGPACLWVLLSFTVILPDRSLARVWTPMLENFTDQLVREAPDVFFGWNPAVPLTRFHLSLLPLGLAYAKTSQTLPLIEDLIQRGLKNGDERVVEGCLAGLGPIGFYYPAPALAAIRTALPEALSDRFRPVLKRSLAAMRILHFDQVDLFLREIRADEPLRLEVAEASDVELIKDYVMVLGLFNNAVHEALNYPKMRRDLLIGGLRLLVESETPREFIRRYTPVPIRMLREASWRGMAWTEE